MNNASSAISTWLLRLALALLLFFCSEILLWLDPLQRELRDWLILIPGYVALGTLLLDLAARYRIRSIYDTMTLAAIYGLLVGLLLNPETMLNDLPRTLMTRVIGAQALFGLIGISIFAAFCGGELVNKYWYRLLGFSLWEGAYWGIWGRWSPSLIDWTQDEIALTTMFLFALPLLSAALLLTRLAARAQTLTPPDLRLSPAGFGVLMIAALSLLLVRIAQEVYTDPTVIPVILAIMTGCGAVLWFRRPEKGDIIMDTYVPVRTPAWRWLGSAGIIFISSTVFFYSLPLLNILGYNQLSLMEFGFAAVGFLWFPIIAIIIGGRAVDRQMSRLNT